MVKWRCKVCAHIYDPEKGDPYGGIKPGTPFEKLWDDWVCPVCGAGKDQFEKEEKIKSGRLDCEGRQDIPKSQSNCWTQSSTMPSTEERPRGESNIGRL